MGFSLVQTPEETKKFKMREMNRILELPINRPLSPQIHREFSDATLLPTAEIDCLLPTQSEAIAAYLRTGGLFGYIGVGKGKALISVACAVAAYRAGKKKIILLIPPKLTLQTVEKVLPWLRKQMPVNLPVHVVSGKNKKNRTKAAQARSGLFIMAWSQLSIVDTDELIQTIAPELIIADEAHNLSNKGSSRYKRINRYMVQHPETQFVCLSGTMGKKSLLDYYHLMKWALKDKCPMPNTEMETTNWASVLDTSYNEHTTSTVLHPMLRWAQEDGLHDLKRDIAGYRKAYNHRLSTTTGVVFAVGEDDLGTSITFSNEPVEVPDDYPGMDKLKELLDQLHHMDTSPDGDIIDFAIHKFRHDYELTCGFYNSLRWPSIEKIMRIRGLEQVGADDLLERSKDYHRARQDYHRILRLWLKDSSREGLDTPLLLGTNMTHHGAEFVGDELYDAWSIMKNFDFEGRLERDSVPVRVCDYKIQAALRWAKSLKGSSGIIWYKNNEVGRWAYEILAAAGLDVVLCDASKKGNAAMNNDEFHTSKILIASITAYREGINAQPIEHVYFLQFPREAHFAEQAVGRNHRTGSPYDELTYTTNFSNEFDKNMFSAVLADALFQHQAGSEHKLIYGSYDPPPKIASSGVLREMGIVGGKDRYGQIENDLNKIFTNNKK